MREVVIYEMTRSGFIYLIVGNWKKKLYNILKKLKFTMKKVSSSSQSKKKNNTSL